VFFLGKRHSQRLRAHNYLNITNYHSWRSQLLHLAPLIITLDTIVYHTRHITRPNNATKPPMCWWSYTTTWMKVESNHHIQVQPIPIPKLPTPKSIISEPIRSSKVRHVSSEKRWWYSINQEGGELVFKTKMNFLNQSYKNFFCTDCITKLCMSRTQSILNQSTLCTRSFIKVLSFAKIYLEPFWKLINTWMRDKDKIKRRDTQPFYIGSLTEEANPKPELDFHYA